MVSLGILVGLFLWSVGVDIRVGKVEVFIGGIEEYFGVIGY